jgi:SOS-response transcriptional repressor LexA
MSGARTEQKARRFGERLTKAWQAKGYRTAREFADEFDLSEKAVSDHLNGKHVARKGMIAKYAECLGVSVEYLLGEDVATDRVNVIGQVCAGQWNEAFAWAEDDQYTAFALPSRHPSKERFALEVSGDSMDLLYPDGSILDCVEFSEADLTEGRRVIVQRTDVDGLVEATVKELRLGPDDKWLLFPRSSNPEHQPVFWNPSTTDSVQIIAIVVGAYLRE